MQKWKKVVLWITAIVIITFGGLMALGYSMHMSAENYVKENTKYKNVEALTQSDDIMCAGSATGLVVVQRDTKEPTFFPICVPFMGDTSLGEWVKK